MLRQVMTSCKHKDCNYHDDDGDGKNSDDDDDGNDDDNEDGDEVEGRARRKAAAGRDQSGLTESCWGQSLLPCLPQRATKNVIISILLLIINIIKLIMIITITIFISTSLCVSRWHCHDVNDLHQDDHHCHYHYQDNHDVDQRNPYRWWLTLIKGRDDRSGLPGNCSQ